MTPVAARSLSRFIGLVERRRPERLPLALQRRHHCFYQTRQGGDPRIAHGDSKNDRRTGFSRSASSL